MNSFQFQSADRINISKLIEAKQAVWPQENCDPQNIAQTLNSPHHHTAVWMEDGRVAAFVDGFLTADLQGQPRWEVDLLGTRPEYRGRGLARALIEDSLVAGFQRGARFARALIQVENAASQRAFAACGFCQTPATWRLWVCADPLREEVNLPRGQALVAVQTINYQGVWLEGELSKEGLLSARAWLSGRQGQICGVLIPIQRADLHAAAQSAGYELVDDYHWWLCDHPSETV